jgi:hypothetical protein
VPFTTPLLAGARVRRSNRSGIELVVPNPSGGRGVYILLWPGVRELCNPTIHDRVLIQRVTLLSRIDPASIRDVALEVALEGYAGREAIAAAKAASDNDLSRRLLTHFLLLAELVQQVEPTGRKATKLTEWTPDFERRAGHILRRIAAAFGRPAEFLTTGLAAMGTAFAPVGVGGDERTARIPRLIARLTEARTDISSWLAAEPGDGIGPLGRTVTERMRVTCNGSEALLAHARAALADPMALLKRWVADPEDPVELASRCDWLLDGWDCICLLWKTAESEASRRAALLEMTQLLPVLPRQVTDWLPIQIRPDTMDPACRVTSRNDTWRSGGAALTLIQRNETLRSMSM